MTSWWKPQPADPEPEPIEPDPGPIELNCPKCGWSSEDESYDSGYWTIWQASGIRFIDHTGMLKLTCAQCRYEHFVPSLDLRK